MAKMWKGRTDGKTSKVADDFNSSIKVDKRLYRQDILGSVAHAEMLGKQGIITSDEAETLVVGLKDLLADLESGALTVDESAEDVHMFVEEVLTARLGDVGKKLHTARSRNDQVTLDLRLYLIEQTAVITAKINDLIGVIVTLAEKYASAIMPGYTHLQRAQPVSFGHHLSAYGMMLLRDRERFADALKRTATSPIGSCALAGTTYSTDREYEANRLNLASVCLNSMDGVSDRDYCVEFLSNVALTMAHLSRFAEEIILWTSAEFSFVELSDEFTTGSSIMPQKKNSDMAELVRGKTGRVYGNLMGMLTVLKGLPLAYNKDMQEDKECVFDSLDTLCACLDVMTPMLESMKVKTENMRASASKGFINATDLADYLVGKGLPFRSAYKISGEIVAKCIADGQTLETLPLEEYRAFSELFDEGVYDAVNLENCMARRNSLGGTSENNVKMQVEYLKKSINA